MEVGPKRLIWSTISVSRSDESGMDCSASKVVLKRAEAIHCEERCALGAEQEGCDTLLRLRIRELS